MSNPDGNGHRTARGGTPVLGGGFGGAYVAHLLANQAATVETDA